jgi:hypothetical protein
VKIIPVIDWLIDWLIVWVSKLVVCRLQKRHTVKISEYL